MELLYSLIMSAPLLLARTAMADNWAQHLAAVGRARGAAAKLTEKFTGVPLVVVAAGDADPGARV